MKKIILLSLVMVCSKGLTSADQSDWQTKVKMIEDSQVISIMQRFDNERLLHKELEQCLTLKDLYSFKKTVKKHLKTNGISSQASNELCRLANKK